MPEINTNPPVRVGMSMLQRAQLNYNPTCQTCFGDAHGDTCVNCCDPICDECAITCSGCGATEPWCVRCALSRQAFEERDGAWYCENCPAEELPAARKHAASERADDAEVAA